MVAVVAKNYKDLKHIYVHSIGTHILYLSLPLCRKKQYIVSMNKDKQEHL